MGARCQRRSGPRHSLCGESQPLFLVLLTVSIAQEFDRIEKEHQDRRLRETVRALREFDFLSTWKLTSAIRSLACLCIT